jgi:uncharacterized protein YciI
MHIFTGDERIRWYCLNASEIAFLVNRIKLIVKIETMFASIFLFIIQRMKAIYTLISLFMCLSLLSAQTIKSEYNKDLADSLGADIYGMKTYVFVILKTGETTIDNPEKVSEIFRGHLDNIARLATENKLVLAGPLATNEHSYRGIYIFDVKTIEEAKLLLKTDPAIVSGLLDADTFLWYGSAALPAYLDVHKKIEK